MGASFGPGAIAFGDGAASVSAHSGDAPSRGAMAVHFSGTTDLWATPQDLFDRYHARHGFTLDVCATNDNAKCPRYFTEAEDGLAQHWTGTCWMNPPYGREIGRWMRKAYEASLAGATVVCLVPARTDTAWWHDYAAKGEVEFLRGRLKFGGRKKDAPFPSAVVVFRPRESDTSRMAETGTGSGRSRGSAVTRAARHSPALLQVPPSKSLLHDMGIAGESERNNV